MINALRGEISAEIDGKQWTLCLTLGALASLETSLGAENLAELSNKFANGKLSANDLIKIITAGLIGAGHDLSEADVGAMTIEGGVSAYVDIAARLLTATFSPATDSPDGE